MIVPGSKLEIIRCIQKIVDERPIGFAGADISVDDFSGIPAAWGCLMLIEMDWRQPTQTMELALRMTLGNSRQAPASD